MYCISIWFPCCSRWRGIFVVPGSQLSQEKREALKFRATQGRPSYTSEPGRVDGDVRPSLSIKESLSSLPDYTLWPATPNPPLNKSGIEFFLLSLPLTSLLTPVCSVLYGVAPLSTGWRGELKNIWSLLSKPEMQSLSMGFLFRWNAPSDTVKHLLLQGQMVS